MEYNINIIEQLKKLMDLMNRVVFPGMFGKSDEELDRMSIKVLLKEYIGEDRATAFVDRIPEIKRLLDTDVEAMMHNDPAATSKDEIILCYPAIKVMTHYRTAHELLLLGVELIPRIITEMAHSVTGIDIHPAARIGDHFAIDHGTGVVIGATTIIGSNVTLYQGVTLGAKNFKYDESGHPLDIPRHPVLEDNVTVYSNTSILGRVTIGHDTVVGGNIWLTHDVPANSKVLQSQAVEE